MNNQSESFFPWFMRRFGWFWILCALLGFGIAFLRSDSPAGFRIVEVIGAILATLLMLFYLSCLPQKRLTFLERLALIVAVFGSGIVAARLFLPAVFPQHYGYYLLAGFVCVFVVNPVLDHFGYDPKNYEREHSKPRLP